MTLSRLAPLVLCLLLTIAAAPTISAQDDLLVVSNGNNTVKRFDATTGAYVGDQITGLSDPQRFVVGPDANIYVANGGTNEILKFDGQTGASMGVFVNAGSGTMTYPSALVFGVNGNLFVASRNNQKILEYDGTTGAFVGEKADLGQGLLFTSDLALGPDGNFYLSDQVANHVLRINAITGVGDIFVAANTGNLSVGGGLVFGPNGNLFVSSVNNDRVIQFHGTTGALVNTFVAGGAGGLDIPRGLSFGADGHLYVASSGTNSVKRYDGATGAFVDDFATTGLSNVQQPGFRPGPPVSPPQIVTDHFRGTFTAGNEIVDSGDAFVGSYTFDRTVLPFAHPDVTLDSSYVAMDSSLPGTGWEITVHSSVPGIGTFSIVGTRGSVALGNDTSFGDRYVVTLYGTGVAPLPGGLTLNLFQLDIQGAAVNGGQGMLSDVLVDSLPDLSVANSTGGRFFTNSPTCGQCGISVNSLFPSNEAVITNGFQGTFAAGNEIVSSGDAFVGSYTFDRAVLPFAHPDVTLDSSYVAMDSALPGTGWQITVHSSVPGIGTFTIVGTRGSVALGNDTSFGDRYLVTLYGTGVAPLPGGLTLNLFQLDIQGAAVNGGQGMLSDVLVDSLPDLSIANSTGGRFFTNSPTCSQCGISVSSLTRGITAPDPGSTPSGVDVIVQPVDVATGTAPVALTFDTVTAPGTSEVVTSGNGAPSPTGFKLGSPPTYYEITTDAAFVGGIEICIQYGDSTFGNELRLKLFHFEDLDLNGVPETWVDITSSIDTAANIICGLTTSLSPFVVFEEEDTDQDGLTDNEEVALGTDPNNPDSDGDQLTDGDEVNIHATDPSDADSDDDGLSDGVEIGMQVFAGCPNPLVPDSDGDGLSDGQEVGLGLNPCDADFDQDGLPDGGEIAAGTDPMHPDTDGDGLMDGTEIDMAQGSGCPSPLSADSDGDTLSDGAEVLHSDPSLRTSPCLADTDGDTIPDNIDPLPLDRGGTSGFLEDQLRTLCTTVGNLSISLFSAPNDNARKGRRHALCNKIRAAARAVASGDYGDASDVLQSAVEKLDGQPAPSDWMYASPQRDSVRLDIEGAIVLLSYLIP